MFGSISKREFGLELEKFAAKQLALSGCEIIETNFLCKLGEIDIILKDGNVLVFVEVRFRQRSYFGGASASVDKRKQNKLIKTASYYLQSKNLTNRLACRFDVFAIEGLENKLNYNWIKDAFSTTH